MLKKILTPPEFIRKGAKIDGNKTIWVAIYPQYNESHLVIYDNLCGVIPLVFAPTFHNWICDEFNPKKYEISAYKRRKEQKLSGQKAFIYALVNISTKTPYYIGSTKNEPYKRMRQHRYSGLAKDGEMILLCECPIEFQFQEEARWKFGAKKNFSLKNKKY